MWESVRKSHPQAELWWDSLPTSFEPWLRATVAQAPAGEREGMASRLEKLLRPASPAESLFTGSTSNPRLVFEAICTDRDRWIGALQAIAEGDRPLDERQIYWRLYLEIFRQNAALMLPQWEASQGQYGWVCAQLLPESCFDAEAMVRQGAALAALSPNLMVKVPGSREGFEAIERLTALGVSTNCTLAFTVPQFLAGVRAIARGLAEADRRGVDRSRWRAVLTYMIGRFGAEEEFRWQAAARGHALSQEEIRWAEVAIYKKIYRLIEQEGHPVKMLLCSLKLDATADDVSCFHLERSTGSNCVYTMPPGFLSQLARLEPTGRLRAGAIDEAVPDAVMRTLMAIPYFRQAYDEDGMAPEAFAFHPAFLNGLREANAAYRRTLDLIRTAVTSERNTPCARP